MLSSAVAAELSRLNTLLRAPGAYPQDARQTYPVLPVLRQHVALRRSWAWTSGGRRARACALGSPSTLAQVLTNVLANCARHAPGVRCGSRPAGSWTRSGFGCPTSGPVSCPVPNNSYSGWGPGRAVQGDGLGLHISRRLLGTDGGRMFIRAARPSEPGCTVVLELPAAVPERAGSSGPPRCRRRPDEARG